MQRYVDLGFARPVADDDARRLQREKEAWEALTASPRIPVPTPATETDAVPAPSSIDSTLLDPEQSSILSKLSTGPDASASTQQRLQAVASGVELTVDRLRAGVHRLSQFRGVAERVADGVLAATATQLQRRDEAALDKAGTRDLPMQEVLRALAERSSTAPAPAATRPGG